MTVELCEVVGRLRGDEREVLQAAVAGGESSERNRAERDRVVRLLFYRFQSRSRVAGVGAAEFYTDIYK